MNLVATRLFQADYAACLALSDALKAENAAVRARCMADTALASHLLQDAKRRGKSTIDWDQYFRNIGF